LHLLFLPFFFCIYWPKSAPNAIDMSHSDITTDDSKPEFCTQLASWIDKWPFVYAFPCNVNNHCKPHAIHTSTAHWNRLARAATATRIIIFQTRLASHSCSRILSAFGTVKNTGFQFPIPSVQYALFVHHWYVHVRAAFATVARVAVTLAASFGHDIEPVYVRCGYGNSRHILSSELGCAFLRDLLEHFQDSYSSIWSFHASLPCAFSPPRFELCKLIRIGFIYL